MNTSYKEYLQLIQTELEGLLDDAAIPGLLRESMAYSVLSGGKRLRAMLILWGAELFDIPQGKALCYAAAIEMIHAYSLIHDDLPCMDNDTLRRGLPTSHVKFGEANALLAGDGLLNFAYEVLLDQAADAQDIAAIRCLAEAAGVTGMIAGQSLDINSQGIAPTFELLQQIHRGKTGALIRAAAMIPALLAGEGQQVVDAMAAYGENLGLAFQITDDILDVVGDEKTLGKSVGKDAQSDKLTYVKLFGMEIARQMAMDKTAAAIGALEPLAVDTAQLTELAMKMVDRMQ